MELDSIAGKIIREAIERKINAEIENISNTLSFNKIKRGKIKEINITGYTVQIENNIYRNVPIIRQDTIININDVVQIVIPNNQYSQMFILGKLVNINIINESGNTDIGLESNEYLVVAEPKS